MIQISHSPALQALGYAIINSLWQFAFLWLIYLLINSFIKFTSHQRYATALALQFAGFCWFVVTAIFYYGECVRNIDSVITLQQGYASIAAAGSSLSFKELLFSFILRAELLLPYLSVAYLILITCFTIKVVKSYRTTQTLRFNGLNKIDVKWRLFVNQISNQLGIKKQVRIYISNLIESPVTIGYFKPLILLPIAVVNNLSSDQIEAILIHEMAHIKRNDYLINILISIVEVTLFFNPFMQLISKQLRRERENSCDDWVLQYEYNACNYAKALLKIATYKTSAVTNFAINAVDNRRALLVRVKRMIEKKDLCNTYRQQLVSLIFITAAISSLAWFTPKNYPSKNTTRNSLVKVEVESLVSKVDNPLFNPVFFLAEDDKKELITSFIKVENEVKKSLDTVSRVSVSTQVEREIVDQFTTEKVKSSTPENKDIRAVNLVLDSALFQNYATKALVVSEIKKLKKEFEMLNKSSLFQNVDWKQFWDNTKVQKQLETAFEQLKAIELQQKRKSINTITVSNAVINQNEIINEGHEQLKMLTNKKLSTIVQNRINDIKHQQNTIPKKIQELNFNFDLPDFSNLNINNEDGKWSYSYSEKPKTALRVIDASKQSGCNDVKEKNKTRLQEKNREVLIDADVTEERIRRAPATRTLKIIRI